MDSEGKPQFRGGLIPVIGWQAIVTQHGPGVYRTAWRILGHPSDAEDVVQETFLEACRLAAPESVENWGAFLRKVATYRALDRRRQRRPAESLEGDYAPDPAHGPEDEAIGQELRERLREAVAQLPEREGAVFCMRYFENLSYQEIGLALEMSHGAVAGALYKARAKLEASLVQTTPGE